MKETAIAGFPALTTDGDPQRPLLLMLHGAFVTHASWAPWLAELERLGWRTIAPSRRGRLGVGPERAEGLRVADYVQDTLAVLDALDEQPVVVGHSLGGLIAQVIAEQGRCKAASLISTAPPAMLTAQLVALPAYLPMLPKIVLGAPVRPSCSGCERIALNCVPESERTRIHESLVHESGTVYREMMAGAVRVDASRVKCPVHVMGGREDRIISVASLTKTAKHYGVEAEVLDGHGHWLVEEPGYPAIVARLDRWLAGLGVEPRAAAVA